MLTLIIAGLLLVSVSLLAAELHKRKIFIWLPDYLRQKAQPVQIATRSTPQHILFCFVDHFEPGWNNADIETEIERVKAWEDGYPQIAKLYRDADGHPPRHTWFYPPHYFRENHILKLLHLCRQGFGEIEMHLHHNRMEPFPDTSSSLRQKILQCIELYSQYGIFETKIDNSPARRYAFIHGDWALANSRKGYCGVSNELAILKDTGCYADFTFPSYMIESQPRRINSIYYIKDDPTASKPYDTGVRVCVGGIPSRDIMMIQGPLGFRFRGRRRKWFPSVDDGEIAGNNPPTKERIDFWVNTGIHVLNRPEWIVIKVFTHGAPRSEHGTLLGEPIHAMHGYLHDRYNDGQRYCLHYVTARELYNIIKASEMNMNGNPGQYRNFIMAPYQYREKPIRRFPDSMQKKAT